MSSIKNFGNLNEYLKLVDNFQDGKGNQRAGTIIGNYFKYSDRGLNQSEALEKAINNYKIKWEYEKTLHNNNNYDNSNNHRPLNYISNPKVFPRIFNSCYYFVVYFDK